MRSGNETGAMCCLLSVRLQGGYCGGRFRTLTSREFVRAAPRLIGCDAQRAVDQLGQLRVRQAVVRHPASLAERYELMRSQQAELVTHGAFVHTRDRGKVADAQFVLQQGGEYPEARRISQDLQPGGD